MVTYTNIKKIEIYNMKKKTKKGNIRVKNKSITKRKYNNDR